MNYLELYRCIIPLARREFRSLLLFKPVWLVPVGLLLLWWLSFPDLANPRTEHGEFELAHWGADVTLVALQPGLSVLVFVGGIGVGYRAISRERESGSIRIVAAMPHRRWHVVVGKLVGRWGALMVTVLVGITSAVTIGLLVEGFVSPATLVLFVLVTALYALACVSIGIAISTLSGQTSVTTLIAGGVLAAGLFWQEITGTVYTIVTGQEVNVLRPPADGALYLLNRVAVTNQYRVVTNTILDAGNGAAPTSLAFSDIQPQRSTNWLVAESAFTDEMRELPWYLAPEVSLVLVVCWLALSLALGIVVYRRGDLV